MGGVELGDDHQHGGDDDHHQRQLPVHGEQIHAREQEHAHAVDHPVVDIADKVAAPVQVGGHAGHQVARPVLIEEAHVVVLQLAEELGAQVEKDILRVALQQDDHQVPRGLTPQLDRQHHRQNPQQGFRVLRDDHVVNQPLRQRGVHQQQRAGDGADHQCQNLSLVQVGVHVVPEPFDLPSHLHNRSCSCRLGGIFPRENCPGDSPKKTLVS